MKKFIFLSFFYINALANETHLLCEYSGKAFKNNEHQVDLKGTYHYFFNEKKQSFETDNGISLCNLWKKDGLFKENILINKKSIYFQCQVSEVKNLSMTNIEVTVKINRISGEYSEKTKMTSKDKEDEHLSFIDGFCTKANAKF